MGRKLITLRKKIEFSRSFVITVINNMSVTLKEQILLQKDNIKPIISVYSSWSHFRISHLVVLICLAQRLETIQSVLNKIIK